MDRQKFINTLLDLTRKYHIKIQENGATKFYIYYNELFKWNKSINLISKNQQNNFITRHIIDSLSILNTLNTANGDKLMDLGSGNGLPGVPLAIMLTKNKIDLIESNMRKCVFLRHIKSCLELQNVSIICQKLSNLDNTMSKYNIILVRGVKILAKDKKTLTKMLERQGNLIIYGSAKSYLSLLNSDEKAEVLKGIDGRKIVNITRCYNQKII